MTNDRPNTPDPLRDATDLANGGNLPNSENPNRVGLGFPTDAVDELRAINENAFPTYAHVPVPTAVLDKVVAWIERYVPRALPNLELSLGADVGELRIEEPDLEVELIRFNGRTFVEETPAIAVEGHFTAGRCAVHGEDTLDGAAVFDGSGEPFCLIDADTVVGGNPLRRAELLASLLNTLGRPEDGEVVIDGERFVRLDYDPPIEETTAVVFRGRRFVDETAVVKAAIDRTIGTVIDPGEAGRAAAKAAALCEPYVVRARPEWPLTPPVNHEAANRERAGVVGKVDQRTLSQKGRA